ncbi:MAG TPA: YHS domain-containing protein [Candidatus Limnocylindrales bacterium]|jgi:Cu+-exporting ATPase|nr:YHS domain-containing protein [Candidatus Limnocylindrales bacterium]
MAIAIDPVCGMEVETEGADLTAAHAGTTYYFCGRGCLLDFRDEPDRFVGGDRTSTPSTASTPSVSDPASAAGADSGR